MTSAKAPPRSKGTSEDPLKEHFGPWLVARLRESGMYRKSVEKCASILHGAVLDELMRLSAVSGLELRVNRLGFTGNWIS